MNLLNVQLICKKNTQGAYGAKIFIDFISFLKTHNLNTLLIMLKVHHIKT